MRRRLHGRRGLKSAAPEITSVKVGRRLHGRRGLKYRRILPERPEFAVAAFTGGVD